MSIHPTAIVNSGAVIARDVDPCLSRCFAFDELPLAHQLMRDNAHPAGNMAILINATGEGQGASG